MKLLNIPLAYLLCVCVYNGKVQAGTLAKFSATDENINFPTSSGHDHQQKNMPTSYRRAIIHNRPMKGSRATPELHHNHLDRCYFKRCLPGKRCIVDDVTGRAKCVCRKHCRSASKPVCGTDGEFYISRCEMYKTACEAGRNVYDARHKDCFYKKSTCTKADLTQYQEVLLQFHQATMSMTRQDGVVEIQEHISRRKRNLSNRNRKKSEQSYKLRKTNSTYLQTESQKILLEPFTTTLSQPAIKDATKSGDLANVFASTSKTYHSSDGNKGSRLPDDDIITNDPRGDNVKMLFKYLDLDVDDLISNEELYEVTIVENLDAVFPLSCSLYHLLHEADRNHDNALDIHELFKIYNITELSLSKSDQVVNKEGIYGKSTTIQCGIQGEQNPIWYRYGYDLAIHREHGVQVDGSTLHLIYTHPKHAGNYSCQARMHPYVNQIIKFSVYTSPIAQIFPRTQHRVIGSSVSITCRVTGIPTPHITWLINGKVVDNTNEKYLLLENRTELHINSAVASDSAAYSCLATNIAGTTEEAAAVFIKSEITEKDRSNSENAAFLVFHDDGILIVEPSSCMTLRSIAAKDTVPGLLRQNKLCKASPDNGMRRCKWSVTVAVGSRFVYAAQPEENRVIVVDMRLLRVVEVLSTDPIPAALHYVKSTDQLFVHCLVDHSRDHSTLLVVHAASVPGTHSAVQIQPLDGGNVIDLSVYNFFVPPESVMNRQAQQAFVAHKSKQSISLLDLSSLRYADDVINLEAYNCSPSQFSYQPIGGRLDVTCMTREGEIPRSVTIEIGSNRVVSLSYDANYDQEFVALDSNHVTRTYLRDRTIKVFKISSSGELIETASIFTEFKISDVLYRTKPSDSNSTTVYISIQNKGSIIYKDLSNNGEAKVLRGLGLPNSQSEMLWHQPQCPLVASSWYDDHFATISVDGLEIIDIVNNEITCRVNNIIKPTAIAWSDSQI